MEREGRRGRDGRGGMEGDGGREGERYAAKRRRMTMRGEPD